MRLLIATPLYPPEPGGPATHTRLLEEGLPQHGIEVGVVKFSDVRKYPKFLRHLMYLLKLASRARHADVLLVQDTVSCGLPAALAALLTRTPLVVRVPGDYAWEQGRQRFGAKESLDYFQETRQHGSVRFLQKIQSWVSRRGNLVIVPSKYFASVVAHWGVLPERLKVVYHGMPPIPDVTVPPNVPERPFMVSVGRLVPWKGFSTLMHILKDLPDWRLVIIGSGPDAASLKEAARTLKVEDRVLFTGGMSREEVLGWCKAADAFVLNTSFESFSFQVLEAMALGSRIVTTNIGSIPELVTDGREGVLLAPDDREGLIRALRSTQGDAQVWEKRREAARQRARDFSMERMLEETAKYLHSLV